MNKKIKLIGRLYGTKILKEYINPDIYYIVVDGDAYQQNWISLSSTKEKNSIYIYISYNQYIDNKQSYTGRWYDTEFIFNKNLIDSTNNTITLFLKNTRWTNYDTDITTERDITIQIFLSSSGFKKMNDFINEYQK